MKKKINPEVILGIFYILIILSLLIGALKPQGISFSRFWGNPFESMEINEFVVALSLALFLPFIYRKIQKVKLFGAELELRNKVEKVNARLNQVDKEMSGQKYDNERAMFAILSRLNVQVESQPRREGKSLQEVPIEIGSLDFAESWILAEIVYQKLQVAGVPVAKPRLGESTLMTFFNLLSGKKDLFIWYSGTGMALAGMDVKPHEADAGLAALNKLYDKWELIWLPPLGFETIEGPTMLREKADKLKINTMEDLARISHRLVFGANREYYLRDWSYPRLRRKNIMFRDRKEVSINDRLSGLFTEDFDVGIGYTTDPEMNDYRLKFIKADDNFKHISQFAMPLCRKEVVKEVEAALSDLKITPVQMSKMNTRAKKDSYKKRAIKGLVSEFHGGDI